MHQREAITDCLFCQIVAGAIPATPVYRTTSVIVIPDLHPKAPLHLLIIPTLHIPTMNDLQPRQHGALLGAMVEALQVVTREQGVAERGYRVIVNTHADGGQEVLHLHWHVVAGRPIGPIVVPA